MICGDGVRLSGPLKGGRMGDNLQVFGEALGRLLVYD